MPHPSREAELERLKRQQRQLEERARNERKRAEALQSEDLRGEDGQPVQPKVQRRRNTATYRTW